MYNDARELASAPCTHAARLARPCELGLDVEGDRYQLVATRRSVKVSRPARLGRSHVKCNRAELTRLVMGHLDLDEAVAAGRLETSTRTALETARALSPQVPFWRPPLDDLYA